jgi:hypothetical protein
MKAANDNAATGNPVVSRSISFTQAQMRRAVRGAESAGMRVRSITVKPDGSIVIDGADVDPRPVKGQTKALAGWDDA